MQCREHQELRCSVGGGVRCEGFSVRGWGIGGGYKWIGYKVITHIAGFSTLTNLGKSTLASRIFSYIL